MIYDLAGGYTVHNMLWPRRRPFSPVNRFFFLAVNSSTFKQVCSKVSYFFLLSTSTVERIQESNSTRGSPSPLGDEVVAVPVQQIDGEIKRWRGVAVEGKSLGGASSGKIKCMTRAELRGSSPSGWTPC